MKLFVPVSAVASTSDLKHNEVNVVSKEQKRGLHILDRKRLLVRPVRDDIPDVSQPLVGSRAPTFSELTLVFIMSSAAGVLLQGTSRSLNLAKSQLYS